MALVPTVSGELQPQIQRVMRALGLVLRAEAHPSDGDHSSSDFSIEVGTAVPTHALPGSMTHGLYLRAGGSLAAMLYATATGDGTWTAVAIP